MPALFLEPARLVAQQPKLSPANWCWMSRAEQASSRDRLPKNQAPTVSSELIETRGCFLSRDAWRLQSAGRLPRRDVAICRQRF